MNGILEQIADSKRIEIAELKLRLPEEKLTLPDPDTRRSLRAALSSPGKIKVIAELKKASPSRGVLVEEFDPEDLAARYRQGGAVALSVLTEHQYFHGRLEYMDIAKQTARLPVLCKDFVIDPYQFKLAAHHGADAILLIVRLLTRQTLTQFIQLAKEVGLDALVEVHSEGELEIALESSAEMIGVNSRNLQSFEVDLSIAEKLSSLIPDDKIKVAESGIHTRADIDRLTASGYDCFLIGESLMRHPDPAQLLRELIG